MPRLTRRATLGSLLASAIPVETLPFEAQADGQAARLTFLLVNDVYEMSENAQHRGGFARLATVVKAQRERAQKEGRFFLFAHAGDTLSPSLMSSFDEGVHMIALFNALGLDCFIPGNHEFDFGVAAYKQRVSEANFAIVAANLREASGEPLPQHKDVLSFEHAGLKIALIGAAYDTTPAVSRSEDLVFKSTLETISTAAKAARRNGADFVVACVHANKAAGNAMMAAHDADLILSGHNHDLHLDFDGRTALAESHQDANYVVVIDIDVTRTKASPTGLSWWPDFQVIDTAHVEPDADMLTKIKAYEGQLSKELDRRVGELAAPLDSRGEVVRTSEVAIGNLVADAMRKVSGADVALTNGGGIRGNRLYPQGMEWTRRDVLTELPFGNKLVTIPMTGAMIRAALEHGFARLPQASGGFPQISGMEVSLDPLAMPGLRLRSVMIGGVPLEADKTYRLATNDFLARGGDAYKMLAQASAATVDSGDILLARAVMDYVAATGIIDEKVEGRIKVL